MNICPNCKKEFHCGAKDDKPCWCCELPNVVPLDSNECLCKECLEKKIKAIQKVNILDLNSVSKKLERLKSDISPLFGIMTPQHMIEHLIFVVKFSNGKLPQELMVDERLSKTIKYYTIETDREMSIGFKAPMLGERLIPLLLPDLCAAIESLKKELNDFNVYFEANPDSKPMSPVLGELDHKEWIIFHNKHFTHHFKQFGI